MSGASVPMRIPGRNLRRRRATDRAMRILLGLAALVAAVPLVLVLAYVLLEGLPALNLALLTQSPEPAGFPGGGVAPAVVGTLIMVGLGTLIGTPVAVLAGIYMREYAGGRGATAIRFLVDVLAGVPTIAIGLFAYGLVVVPMSSFSGLAGAIALGIIIIPIVARVTDEMLGLVPGSVREAAYALGIPPWKTIVRVVLPAAASGIVTGILLGVARIAGETAPLIFTALGNQRVTTSLTEPMDALPLRIWVYASGPYDSWHRQAWAASLVLVFLVVAFSVLTRFVLRRRTVRGA
ncbi:MAG: phosphate ABC transporter permease PstA [Candidatus Limnocylindrales bacterium]